MTTYANRLVTTVSAVASAGLGAFTVSTASSGYRTFAVADDAKTFSVVAVEGTSWEVMNGCVYTHSGTTVSRGTTESSSSGGSAIAFTSAAILTVTPTAAMFDALESTMAGLIPGGRLTLESGVPVSTTDQTAKTTIYYTPYFHNVISLWDGVDWVPTTFAETSEALGTLTSGLPYDVFGFLSSGVLDLEKLAWTSGTARATAVTLQDGRYCKSGDKTRLYLGTFYTTSTTTTEDSAGGVTSNVGGKRFVWNMYNRVNRTFGVIDTTDTWTYASGGGFRQARATTGNKVEAIIGLAGAEVDLSVMAEVNVAFTAATGYAARTGVGIDSTGTNSAQTVIMLYLAVTSSAGNLNTVAPSRYIGNPSVGYHYFAWLESTEDSSATITFAGDGAEAGRRQSGMFGHISA